MEKDMMPVPECNLKEVHEANLKILKEIDRICRKYKIKYMLDAGTLLGAVRHKGFIPWDDDADIVLNRSDYEAFIKVVGRELPDGMKLLKPSDLGNGFYDFTARIIYEKSQMHEENEEMQFYGGKLNHLWVDLFVLDKLPKNKLAAKLILLAHTAVYGMAMGHRWHLDYSKYSLSHKIFVKILSSVGKLIPMKLILKAQYMLAVSTKKSNGDMRYYSNYAPDYYYVRLKEEWCRKVAELDFCDTKLMVPAQWHHILSQLYGDYMMLPPKEQRQPAHSSMKIRIFE